MYLYFKAFVNIYVNSHGSDILSSKVVAFIISSQADKFRGLITPVNSHILTI